MSSDFPKAEVEVTSGRLKGRTFSTIPKLQAELQDGEIVTAEAFIYHGGMVPMGTVTVANDHYKMDPS